MTWKYADGEALEGLHQAHLANVYACGVFSQGDTRSLADVLALIDSPMKTLDALRAWADASEGSKAEALLAWRTAAAELISVRQLKAMGVTVVDGPVAPSAPAQGPRQGQAIPPTCLRMVHDFGPPNDHGWVTCRGCGTVNIVGGAKASSGFYTEATAPHGIDLP
jgi:hypothetical protein